MTRMYDNNIIHSYLMPMYMILIVLAVIIGLLLIVITMQPPDFRISRSVTMNVPASKVFDEVNDFRKWEAWSPWEKIDPATKKTYGGAVSGVGATYHWVGNSKVGEGRMTI